MRSNAGAARQRKGNDMSSTYESIDRLYGQLSAQVLEHAEGACAPVLQSLRAAAGEVLDMLYIATTDIERDTLAHSVLARLSAVADAVTHGNTHSAVLVTPEESQAILADCLALGTKNAV